MPDPIADLTDVLAVAADDAADPAAILGALTVLRRVQEELSALEPALVAAARERGVSWQALAPALGVASRQAAERRYLRTAPIGTGRTEATREDRVRAERDHRAGTRAVNTWANDNTADLRRLAGRLVDLADVPAAAPDLGRLHAALAGRDATALPPLLEAVRGHLTDLPQHAGLADQIDAVTARTTEVRRATQRRRDGLRP